MSVEYKGERFNTEKVKRSGRLRLFIHARGMMDTICMSK